MRPATNTRVQDWPEILGLRPHTHMALRAVQIVLQPYDPSKSTAQPPHVCGHARVQFQTVARRWACSVCGHETGPRR
jgi:hypothetical protein